MEQISHERGIPLKIVALLLSSENVYTDGGIWIGATRHGHKYCLWRPHSNFYLPRRPLTSQENGDLKEAVWKRDNGVCQRCGEPPKTIRKSVVHHFIPFRFGIDLANPKLCILLCAECHDFVHSPYNLNCEFLALPINASNEVNHVPSIHQKFQENYQSWERILYQSSSQVLR